MLLFLLVFLVGSAGGMSLCDEDDCLTLFEDFLNFEDAQNWCVQEGGHLLTMRSNRLSSRMASLIQLWNWNGEFWIGLHRLGDCPDPDKKLRGFQWVTNDEETNYTNWSPSFDSSCSSPSCVYVSTRNTLQWVQAPCDGKATGFVCVRGINSCTELKAEQDKGETIRYSQPNDSVDRNKHISLRLPPGFTATLETSGTKYLCVSEQWVPAPWNCEIQEGGCEYKCMMNPDKSPICYCPPGQTVNPVNKRSCEAQPTGDPCQALGCRHTCYKKGDSYACVCPRGFHIAMDGISCLDIDECVDPRQCPVEGTMCVNTLGGFKCACKAGPKSPDKCDIYCDKEECPAKCDPNNMFQCFCPDGFLLEETGTSMICVDIDECQSFSCDQDCKNTYGSYECSCMCLFNLAPQTSCTQDTVTVRHTVEKSENYNCNL
uniref:Thrombomodulin n=1 Tax=Oryzias sinensis TaxID=183150 RepID=A0A8C7YET0_9TELE